MVFTVRNGKNKKVNMKYATLDASHDPVMILHFTGEEPTEESFDDYLNLYLNAVKQKKGRGVVMEAKKVGFVPVKYRIKQGKFLKEHEALLKKNIAGIAFVFKSVITRFMITAVFVIKKPPFPYYLTGDLDEAVRWVQQKIKEQQSQEEVL
ncbi:hypothetical protein M23134_04273 [Microscilla marina ATCC 23134]|uniref:STAS/SEC14 domain-containing protein n=2 Tax=Microscilla marina TaxID=1027 RepID=A1ZED2_MICM2|nr:hypothetical protein M23134_04273 [Microscilla marina ATCC 23134]